MIRRPASFESCAEDLEAFKREAFMCKDAPDPQHRVPYPRYVQRWRSHELQQAKTLGGMGLDALNPKPLNPAPLNLKPYISPKSEL